MGLTGYLALDDPLYVPSGWQEVPPLDSPDEGLTLDHVQKMVAEHWELEKDTQGESSALSSGESGTMTGLDELVK